MMCCRLTRLTPVDQQASRRPICEDIGLTQALTLKLNTRSNSR